LGRVFFFDPHLPRNKSLLNKFKRRIDALGTKKSSLSLDERLIFFSGPASKEKTAAFDHLIIKSYKNNFSLKEDK
jgi:hypothetical protein